MNELTNQQMEDIIKPLCEQCYVLLMHYTKDITDPSLRLSIIMGSISQLMAGTLQSLIVSTEKQLKGVQLLADAAKDLLKIMGKEK